MRPLFRAAVLATACTGALMAGTALAQYQPPSTVFGSINDQAGPVEAGIPVTAYIGGQLCGTGKTEFTGDGAAKVTVYAVNVSSREDKPGCGVEGVDITIKIGDRTASQPARWRAGPVRLDVTFGNVTPVPIPTFTPAPTRTPTPPQATSIGTQGATPASNGTGTAASTTVLGTIPAGSPGAGSPIPTLKGGVTSSRPGNSQEGSADGGGFPLWAVVIIVLGGIAVVGGGVGYAMSRGRGGEDDTDGGPFGADGDDSD